MNIKKNVEVQVPMSCEQFNPDTLQDILEAKGFFDVVISTDHIDAARGSNWATLFIPGDGRRWYHTIKVDQDAVKYKINTWFGIFTRADEKVFEAEAKIIIDEMSGKNPNFDELEYATKKRRLSDAVVILCVIAIGVFGGIALIGLLFRFAE